MAKAISELVVYPSAEAGGNQCNGSLFSSWPPAVKAGLIQKAVRVEEAMAAMGGDFNTEYKPGNGNADL